MHPNYLAVIKTEINHLYIFYQTKSFIFTSQLIGKHLNIHMYRFSWIRKNIHHAEQ